MEVRLPIDKVQRFLQFIEKLLGKSGCTKLELLQLLGHFNFASRLILPGRSFVSYLIRLSTTVKGLHQYVHLDKHCQDDLHMWYRFLTGMAFPHFMIMLRHVLQICNCIAMLLLLVLA